MNYSKLFTTKKIFKYAYVIVIIINVVAIYYLYAFLNKYIYESFFTDREYLISQGRNSSNDINITKFNTIIELIDKKNSASKKSSQISDIF